MRMQFLSQMAEELLNPAGGMNDDGPHGNPGET